MLLASTFVLGAALTAEPEFTLSGESRIRYEALDGQFRTASEGGDQLLAIRTLAKGEWRSGDISFVAELQDSRTYLDDGGTPLSSSFVNALEPLQVYGEVRLGPADRHTLRLGRMTLDVGSRRFIERNNFRNTINAYDGAYWTSQIGETATLHAFAAFPVAKNPADRASRGDNEIALDETDETRLVWAAHLTGARLGEVLRGDVFVYGLHERDQGSNETADRRYVEPGFRIYRSSEPGAVDFELEAAWRFGERSVSAMDPRTIDVNAATLHAEMGYSFEHAWNWRVGLDYDYASGDGDPETGDFTRYERLFGTRRGDLGNTSIHGPLTRQNISAPGGRVSFQKGRADGRLAYKAAYLADSADAWPVASLRDPLGASGDFIGHAIDGRWRYWLTPDRLRLELGGSALIWGAFAETAPGSNAEDRTLYGYAQLTARF